MQQNLQFTQLIGKMFQKRSLTTLDHNLSQKMIPCGIEIQDLKQKLKSYFLQTYSIYERLFTVIKNQKSYYTKPEPLRHPLIFYFGHTAAFFVNKLIDKGLINERINESYERMFAVGVDEMDWDDLSDSHYDWPSLEQATNFRQKVKEMVLQIIEATSETSITWQSDMWIILMGIEHEKIHLETSSVIIRRLPSNEVDQPQWWEECPYGVKQIEKTPMNKMKSVKDFEMIWNKMKQTAKQYGWDNEFGQKIIKTKQHKVSQMLVSNGQYFKFFIKNGYEKIQYWNQQGQNWLKSMKVKKPIFWQIQNQDGQSAKYFLRTITKIIEMPWDWPVEVNNLEAQAFCNWKSQKIGKKMRLPTQDEYFAMRNLLKKDINDWKHGQVGNINLEYWISPNPVDMFETEGFFDVIGNVWQHTITPIYPFQGFEIHPVYQDFTTPTFDTRHNLIKGGSFISTGNEALFHSRYAFRRHFYQFAGFRYVESENIIQSFPSEIDQSDESVEIALRTQYSEKQSYIQKTIDFIKSEIECPEKKSALVVGCSVGRLTFQLSHKAKISYGIDYTARYFQMATRLHEQKELKYRSVNINLTDFDFDQKNYEKVHLYQMSPENPDSKKINGIDLLVIDGNNLRKNTLDNVIVKCLQLCTKEKSPEVFVISNSLKNPGESATDLMRSKGFRMLQQKSFFSLTDQNEEIKVSFFI